MHFSKTYAQLLLTLPSELRENAIEYRQLKKLINQMVQELGTLGLSPQVLQSLLHTTDCPSATLSVDDLAERALGDGTDPSSSKILTEGNHHSKAVYELIRGDGRIEPRLRLWVGTRQSTDKHDEVGDTVDGKSGDYVDIVLDRSESIPASPASGNAGTERSLVHEELSAEDLQVVADHLSAQGGHNLHWTLQHRHATGDGKSVELPHPVTLAAKPIGNTCTNGTREIIISLSSDAAFFHVLQNALETLAAHLSAVREDFTQSLESLSFSISNSALPESAIRGRFHPYSADTDPSDVHSPFSPFSSMSSTSIIPGRKAKTSDLYAWREIFQLYVETEIFESMSERSRGERNIEDSEKRLALFIERLRGRGLKESPSLKTKESREALETFFQLNMLILNLKKFQQANTEAARKILKKRTKRTALPLPTSMTPQSSSLFIIPAAFQQSSQTDMLTLMPSGLASLPHLLVQAIGETLLPVVPHIDDYACLICTSIAFKPIRLACGHLFCVRCLVKMQKAGKSNCPMCRATTVLQANRRNVDWALLNFMYDWFPVETKVKQKQNEKESQKEQLEEMGIEDTGCIVS
ncbi:hypothetical protein BD410DRAFT_785400 [Rickenella mellea]|uniref:RING-14 protein n=1 Tax=Rickenella mellea TaxID=50990 RepID=A0A4Y7QAL9_9AGAM|nr:hypothetical protein BD410DRAFT_785400 [Rickenella mellea]